MIRFSVPDRLREWWQTLSPRAAIAVATALAAMTFLPGQSSQPLAWDETVSATAAERSLPSLMRLLQHTDAPLGAYYLMLHGWVRLLAVVHVMPTEVWLRLPSAVAGVGAVALTASLGARWFDARIGLVAGAMLAVHPLAVFYAHDARPYTLAMLAMLGATALLRPALARPTVTRLAVYGAVVIVGIYAHMFAALVLVGHAVVIVRQRGSRLRFAAVGLGVIVAVTPLILLARHETGEIGWIPHVSVAAVASFSGRFAGGPMALPLLALAVVAYATRRARTHGTSPETAVVILWALVPPVALIAVDLVYPVLVVRYALVSVPAVVLLAAVAAERVRGRTGPVLIVLALLAGAVTSVVQQTQPYKYDDFRAADDAISDTSRTHDGVVFIPASMRVGYDLYRGSDPKDVARPSPVDIAMVPADGPLVAASIGGAEIATTAIDSALASHSRIYLIDGGDAHPNPTDIAKLADLHAQYVRAWTRAYGDITVTLYLRRAA